MKLSRREKPADAEVETVVDGDDAAAVASKGRPTPKRRDSQGKRGPVSAPKTRKEAYARQKQLAKQQKTTRSTAEAAHRRRAACRAAGGATRRVLPRRDQGPTRKLARDYVDSQRMLSNYLLFLFPIMIAGLALPQLQIIVLVVFVGLLVEWYIVGKRIRAHGDRARRLGAGRQHDDRLLRRQPGLPASALAPARPAGRARRPDLSRAA